MTSHSLNTNEPAGKGNDVGEELTRVEELVREANHYRQEASRTGFRTFDELAGFAVKAAYEQAIIDLHSPEPAKGRGEALGRTLEALKTIELPREIVIRSGGVEFRGELAPTGGNTPLSRQPGDAERPERWGGVTITRGSEVAVSTAERLKRKLAEDIRAAELEQANAILETFEAKLRPNEILTAVHSPARHGAALSYGVAIIEASGKVRTFQGTSLRDALGQASQWIGAR